VGSSGKTGENRLEVKLTKQLVQGPADRTNRERTGVSLEHCHYIAQKIRTEGFQPRRPNSTLGGGNVGHEIPVVVRESIDSELGAAALARWRGWTAETPGMPPSTAGTRSSGGSNHSNSNNNNNNSGSGRSSHILFCSLGSSHFNQAGLYTSPLFSST